MEEIEKIQEFLKIQDYYSNRNDCDSSNGAGEGSGYGYRDGSGGGLGQGSGEGNPICDGEGSGEGTGYGFDDYSGYGSSFGDAYNSSPNDISSDRFDIYDSSELKIKKINNESVFYIDEVPTIFEHIHGNIAKGKIVDSTDFSTSNCYIVKNNHWFAHGNTLKQALIDLEHKTFKNMNIDDKISEFRKKFNNKDSYKGEDFFDWHHILTGSCLAGRTNFVESRNYDLNKLYTVKEFIKICENSYGGEVIKKLKEFYV